MDSRTKLLYRRRSLSSSSLVSSRVRESEKVQKLIERVEEVERVNAKFEKKEKEFKFSKVGCDTQFKFNGKIKEFFGDKLKVELKKHFKNGLPDKLEELIKEGEKEIDDQNHKLKIADEFGCRALDDFNNEDLARDEKEEKKLKALWKEKKEREEKSRIRRGKDGYRGIRDGYRGFRDGYRGFRDGFKDNRFNDKRNNREDDKSKSNEDTKYFYCQRFGHMAKDCTKPQAGTQGRR